ncbi:hypothetical protein FQN51_008632 [Onygenales sp. PD_10]|nr:hypothetical protein FQN51_008632 [Onygenales sp. PD_10]
MDSPFGPPPPGLDLTENHTPSNNAIVIAMFVLATVSVVLRFIARTRVQNVQLKADDWLIAAALVRAGLGPQSIVKKMVSLTHWFVAGGYHGLGKHVWSVPIPEVVTVSKLLFIYVLVYVACILLIKLSILMFYRRIFGTNWTIPPSYYWTQYENPAGGVCVFDLYPFYIGNAAVNVVTDGLILMVPIPLVWKLQMRTTKKLMVSGLFLLGGLFLVSNSVCVASIIRIHYMTYLSKSPDFTWIMGDVFIWSSVEPSIGIVCACLPTLQPLLHRTVNTIFGSDAAERFGTGPKRSAAYLRQGKSGSAGSKGVLEPAYEATERKRRIKRMQLWPAEDETQLTTTTATHVEMDSLKRNGTSDIDDDDDGMAIRVKKDFQWQENHHQ